ncbi:MAG: hypothetical protein M1834_002772 [Cirrosporium novae-zelandiae]|nr:MAG: hypothetical protein M1834_002772 [Cirrosporium novae-zelandiae]
MKFSDGFSDSDLGQDLFSPPPKSLAVAVPPFEDEFGLLDDLLLCVVPTCLLLFNTIEEVKEHYDNSHRNPTIRQQATHSHDGESTPTVATIIPRTTAVPLPCTLQQQPQAFQKPLHHAFDHFNNSGTAMMNLSPPPSVEQNQLSMMETGIGFPNSVVPNPNASQYPPQRHYSFGQSTPNPAYQPTTSSPSLAYSNSPHPHPQPQSNSLPNSLNCPNCDQTFTRPADLSRHSGIHDPSRRVFSCLISGCPHTGSRAFYRRDKLLDHQRKKHNLWV